MEEFREQCVSEGKLLGKLHLYFPTFLTEAEEAQSKIEELKDQEYNERRSALLNANDIEMNELVRQRQEHLKEFEQNWNEHEKQL